MLTTKSYDNTITTLAQKTHTFLYTSYYLHNMLLLIGMPFVIRFHDYNKNMDTNAISESYVRYDHMVVHIFGEI